MTTNTIRDNSANSRDSGDPEICRRGDKPTAHPPHAVVDALEAYLPYQTYKRSDEGWIGDIPSHWQLVKLKRIFIEKSHRKNMDLPCGSISFGEVVTKNDLAVPISTKESYQEVLKGEFLVNPLNLNYDLKSLRIALSNIDVVVSAGYIVLLAASDLSKQYFNYLLHRYDVAHMKLLGSGVRQTISFSHIANSLLPTPPLPEQKAIATFLDQKTAKIDQAIKIKEQQITLLKERKQIIIQQAVTRGLNPDAPMKDSGIDWIGGIPAHWESIKLKHLFHEVNKRTETGEEVLLSLRMEIGLIPHDEVSDKTISNQELIGYKIVEPGQLVMNRMRASIGIFGVAARAGLVSPDYAVFDVATNASSKYFLTLFKTRLLGTQFRLSSKGLGTGSSGFMRLYTDNFGDIKIPLCDISEQEQIVQFIQRKTGTIDSGVSAIQSQIDAYKEYKTTLINAAVTGKIKVA